MGRGKNVVVVESCVLCWIDRGVEKRWFPHVAALVHSENKMKLLQRNIEIEELLTFAIANAGK